MKHSSGNIPLNTDQIQLTMQMELTNQSIDELVESKSAKLWTDLCFIRQMLNNIDQNFDMMNQQRMSGGRALEIVRVIEIGMFSFYTIVLVILLIMFFFNDWYWYDCFWWVVFYILKNCWIHCLYCLNLKVLTVKLFQKIFSIEIE